ncbi:MAG: oligosaccharide flippase family protein [Oxalobacteraceae bacterium]|jgi:O-antigen/teichoic acid export membrane protein|nr:oligosaccharide flippase family protein [Oxalobacteraceae bacterium]
MLLRNSLWHLSGVAIPALVALATVPVLISGLGLEGFGIITLITSVVGYFGILDFNLSAGTLKYLAQYHAQKDKQRFAETFWFGALFYGLIGSIGALLLSLIAVPVLTHYFTISSSLVDETLWTLKIAALGFALSQWQNYLVSVPQALQRYDKSAQGEAVFGVLVNVVSAYVALSGGGISGVMAARVFISALNILWLTWLLKQLQVIVRPVWPRRDIRILLTHFSAYAYLSRLASMLHQHADKLIIGSLAGPIALSLYAVPNQLASRILGLTYRLGSVVYPRVSALSATANNELLRQLYLDATRWITYLNFAVLGVIALVGEEFLRRWVGTEFVAEGYPILLLVTFALLLDSLTQIPSLINDGLGHPKITGRFALARGLIGVPMVYVGTLYAGIKGAALAHLLASALMAAIFLVYVHGRTIPISLRETLKSGWIPSLSWGLSALLLSLPMRWIVPNGVSGLLLHVSWTLAMLSLIGFIFLSREDERQILLSAVRRLIPRTS